VAYNAERVVKQLGERIAELRREHGLSQATFAAKLKVTPQWISQIERADRSSPTVDTLVKIANGLGVTIEALFKSPSKEKTAVARGVRRPRKN
jgi:transcriptional regulator with XRE-family HTH domain